MKNRLLLLLVMGLCLKATAQVLPGNQPHFSLQKIAEGVYAAIALPGGHAICNAGIIDLGDATVVIDPFLGLDAAQALYDSAVAITGRKASYVINTHFHDDHVSGNQVFTGARILSTVGTRNLIKEELPKGLEGAMENAITKSKELASEDTTTMTSFELQEHRMWVGYYGAFISNGGRMVITFPDVTFENRMRLSGCKRSIDLLEMGTGHTQSDLVVLIPEDSLLFAGDLLFIEHHPWLGDGEIRQWSECLDSIKTLPVKSIIPGHGPPGSPSDVDALKDYLTKVEAIALQYSRNKKSPFGDADLKIPEKFLNWHLSLFFRPNVYSIYSKIPGN